MYLSAKPFSNMQSLNTKVTYKLIYRYVPCVEIAVLLLFSVIESLNKVFEITTVEVPIKILAD